MMANDKIANHYKEINDGVDDDDNNYNHILH